jgi:hypothetical protein
MVEGSKSRIPDLSLSTLNLQLWTRHQGAI